MSCIIEEVVLNEYEDGYGENLPSGFQAIKQCNLRIGNNRLFIARIYLIRQLNHLLFNNFFKRPGMLEAIMNFPEERILEVRFFVFSLLSIFADKLLGEFLDINFQSIYKFNNRVTTEIAYLFGLIWIRDGATIKRTFIINIFTMCRSKSPSVIAILDSTMQTVDSGKNDAEFVMHFFKSNVNKFDP